MSVGHYQLINMEATMGTFH